MIRIGFLALGVAAVLPAALIGCRAKGQSDPRAEEPPDPEIQHAPGADWLIVDNPGDFPLAVATAYALTPELSVTGVVAPDVSRQVPVPSLVSGRVIEIDARLGDEVRKGQLLFKVRSPDISGAYSDYQKAVKSQNLALENERLAKIQQERAHFLYDHGAISKSALEIADNAEIAAQTALEEAKVDAETAAEHLRLFGSDLDHPSGVVEVTAPVSGVITDQQIAAGAGVQALTAPNPFTISDLSHVWVVCDVYENDLPMVHLNETAEIRLNAYPGTVLRGRISDVGAILDPNVRTAKARIDVENPGVAPGGAPSGQRMLRLGMFARATFHDLHKQQSVLVPASAVLHLQDKDWVFVPHHSVASFHRVEVKTGGMVSGKQLILSGIRPGDAVVRDALMLQNASDHNLEEQ
ncbi:MAG TPA: efflux RND transporter periplasmic adaptor subunit [Bryobacteraceae bacterium]|nr:efflux RND transporter periplasmic adaptor subunit [Bryobacteraceae bacterium]